LMRTWSDYAAANCGRAKPALLLRESERLTCGGANTAVDRLGKVETWLAVPITGAKLPPASQELTCRSKVRVGAAFLVPRGADQRYYIPEPCRNVGPDLEIDKVGEKDERCGQSRTQLGNPFIFNS
jgi:hypothetical protein